MTTQEKINLLNEQFTAVGIPVASQITSENFGDVFSTIQALNNSQINSLIFNLLKVNEQRVFKNIFTAENNDFRTLLINAPKTGWTLEDYFIEVNEGMETLFGETDGSEVADVLYSTYEDKVRYRAHIESFEKMFSTTVDLEKLPKSFIGVRQYDNFYDGKVGNLHNSAEIYLEKEVIIPHLKSIISAGDVRYRMTDGAVHSYDVNTANGLKDLIANLNTVKRGFTQPTNLYNKDAVLSITQNPEEDIVLVCKQSIIDRINAFIIAGAFHEDRLELPKKKIIIPEDMDLGKIGGKDVHFLMFDKKGVPVSITWWETTVNEQMRTAGKLNFFHTVKGKKGYDTFLNMYAFCGETLANFQ